MKKVMGFWRCWGIVVGMMIGSGIFMLPAVLAPFGEFSLVGWIVAGIGTIFIALMFSLLARRKALVGGPYAYTRAAFGDLPGYLIGWGYWISLLAAIAAGAVAITGYLGFFIPSIATNPLWGALTALFLIWLTTGINVAGVKTASTFQLLTSLLKLLPLFLVAVIGLYFGDPVNVKPEPALHTPTFSSIAEMVMIIMWAYIGVECVTIPSDDMIEPEKNIPRALIIGTLTVTGVYIAVSYGVMVLVPSEQLALSTSPLADAASVVLGPWGAGLITLGALVSIISNINANIFVVGVMPQALAQDNLFPKVFSRLNAGGAPARAIVISGFIASLLVVMNYSNGLMTAFKTLILLSTLATVLPYVTSALAELVLQKRDRIQGEKTRWYSWMVVLGALIFSVFAIVGSGLMVSLQGTVLLIIGLPFYFYEKNKYKIKMPDR